MKCSILPFLYITICGCIQLYISNPIRRKSLTHSEDIYHSIRSKELYHAFIHYNHCMGFSEFELFTDKAIEEFNYFIKKELPTTDTEILIRDEYTDEWKSAKIVRIIFFKSKRIITVTFDHTYFGGYHILQCFKIITKAKSIANIQKRIKILGIPEYYALKTLCKLNYNFWRLKYLKQKKLLPINNKEPQYYYEEIPKSSKPKYVKTVYWIIKTILDKIIVCFPPMKRKLNILIPVAFLPEHNVYNNVSAILLEYPQEGMGFKGIEKTLAKLRYQAIGGNYLAQFNLIKSNEIRRNLDVVLSMTYVKKEKYSPITFVFGSGDSNYPIYILAVGMTDSIKISYSVNCSHLCLDQLNLKKIELNDLEKYLGK